ncbi:dienelactone hydrolase family protein [Ravibacter arvi]|uniref:Dienelactone hydrolase family protein n=1 Tax=Ravibacter arvi TaxID=2051041 RepID=A0ABP8M5T3_9BACT
MRLLLLTIWGIFWCVEGRGQATLIDSLGVRHLQFTFNGMPVDLLVASAKNEEMVPKPVLFFCQGSMPKPLIINSDKGPYGVFPFKTDILTQHYHLVIAGKPAVPLASHVRNLGSNFVYTNQEGHLPEEYVVNNHPDFYISRNLFLLKKLGQMSWVARKQIVVAGHSEGAHIAAGMAVKSRRVSHLIYASGNPLGRIHDIIAQGRRRESDTDSTRFGESAFDYWKTVLKDKDARSAETGDPFYTTYTFSQPQLNAISHLKIPVLIMYGTKDTNAPLNDLLRVEVMKKGKRNFTFKPCINCEHNFFPVYSDGTVDHSQFNWDKVARFWGEWIAQSVNGKK